MDPVVLVDIESLKMDSPDVHSMRFSPDPTVTVGGDFGSELDGDIITRSNQPVVEGELNTLDEPIMDTIKRDLNAVWNKTFYALMPMQNRTIILQDWDLWGPLFFATYIGVILQQMNSVNPEASQFAQLILIVCLGIAVVTYSHVVILRTNTSIFQYISVLGYCLAPMALFVSILFCGYILSTGLFLMKFLLFGCAVLLSTLTSSFILRPGTRDDDRINIPFHLLPIVLYYLAVASFIFYNSMSYKEGPNSYPQTAMPMPTTAIPT